MAGLGRARFGSGQNLRGRFAVGAGALFFESANHLDDDQWYIKRNRKLRAVHPRDICDQINDIAAYLNVEPAMTKELLDMAAAAYFVEL